MFLRFISWHHLTKTLTISHVFCRHVFNLASWQTTRSRSQQRPGRVVAGGRKVFIHSHTWDPVNQPCTVSHWAVLLELEVQCLAQGHFSCGTEMCYSLTLLTDILWLFFSPIRSIHKPAFLTFRLLSPPCCPPGAFSNYATFNTHYLRYTDTAVLKDMQRWNFWKPVSKEGHILQGSYAGQGIPGKYGEFNIFEILKRCGGWRRRCFSNKQECFLNDGMIHDSVHNMGLTVQ